MKKPKIYFIELSHKRPDGGRNTVKREILATFNSLGVANICLKHLRENEYKWLLDSNKDNDPNKPIYLLNVEY